MPPHSEHGKQINSTRFLYSNINKDRRTPFLQRNLTQTLNQHKRELQAQNSNGVSACVPSPRLWEPPNEDLASVIASRHSTCELQIQPELAIKPPHQFHSSGSIAHPSLVFTAKCLLTLSIYRKDGGDPWKHKFKDWSDEAALRAYRDGTAIVSMQKPPTFPARVFRGLETEYNGGALRPHVGSRYVLKISLQCAYPSDNRVVFEFLGIDQQRGSGGQYLRSYLHYLPRCPTTDKGFEIKLANSGDKVVCKSEHTLHVSMDWVVPKMSIMEELNHTIRLERGKGSPMPTQSREPLRLTYRCDQAGMQKPLMVQGCLCPICWMRDFRTVERLQLHLKLEHDRFRFAFKEFKPTEGPAPKKVYVRLTFKEGTEKPNSFQEINWIAPSQPFDLDAFLGGDEWWVRGKRPRVLLAAATALGSKVRRKPEDIEDLPKPARKQYKVPRIIQEADKDIILFAMHSRRLLSEGEEIYEDDDATILAHTVSKIRRRNSNMPRAAVKFMDKWDSYMLEEQLNSDLFVGEAVVRFLRQNETWIRENPRMVTELFKKLKELNEDHLISDAFYEFLVSATFSEFLKARVPRVEPTITKAKDVEAGEKRKRADADDTADPFCRPSSPVRTKLNGTQADQPSGKENTSPKDANLLNHGPASNPLLKNSTIQSQPGQRDDKPSGTQKSTTIQGETRQKASQQPPLGDVGACICGEPVAAIDAPSAIFCADMQCIRELFHLSCVGLEKRVAGWRCDDCAAQNAR